MPSFNQSAALLRAVHEDAVDETRKETVETAIKTVDTLISHSTTFESFKARWETTKAVYREHTDD